MKTKIFRTKPPVYSMLFAFAIFHLTSINVQAQEPKMCGGYTINREALTKALEFERNNAGRALTAQHYLVRVYFHIVSYTDGTNPGATATDIQNEFQTLQSDYMPGNICFLNAGLDFINNTALDTVDVDVKNNKLLFDPYRVAGCVNIFYTYKINGSNGNCDCGIGGIAFTSPGTICLIANSNVGKGHSISHETGHCLGLLHTFDVTNGAEDIDESNCANAGDLICDTKADPYYQNQQSCFSISSNCSSLYNGNCSDPKGQTNYTPPYKNTMAYWWASHCFPDLTFSPGQFTRMQAFLSTTFIDLATCVSPDNVVLGPVSYSSGYAMNSAVNTLSTSGAVNITHTTIATLGGQTVNLENGFHALPSGNGITKIEASSCTYTLNGIAISKPAESAITSAINTSRVVAYPNPAKSVVHLDFTTTKNEDNVAIQVFNTEMQKAKEIRLSNLAKGKQSITISLNNISSGVYFIVIQLQSEKLITKISLVK